VHSEGKRRPMMMISVMMLRLDEVSIASGRDFIEIGFLS